MNNQPTIKDVARLAGVSIGTVDRVLHKRGRVSAANQAAVERAIESLHYQPSQVARALSIRRQNLKIGVSYPFVEQNFWTDACQGIQYAAQQLKKFGVEVILDQYSSYDTDDRSESISRLLSQKIHGLVIIPSNDSAAVLNKLIPEDIPYCTVIEDCEGCHRLFHVGPDDYAMGRVMGKQAMLYQPNNLACALIAPNTDMLGTLKRISGFRDILAESGQEASLLEVCEMEGHTEKHSYENVYDKTLELIDSYPDLNTIYITNGLTQWAAAAVIAAGRRNSIRVFGHEYTNMTKEFVESGPITATIYQKPACQWSMAIQLLYEYLVGERTAPEPILHTECSIITKETLPLIQIGQLSWMF